MSQEKTPMQQLLEKLEYAKKEMEEKNTTGFSMHEKGYYDCLCSNINDINIQMIPIEKNVITKAFSDGEQNHVLLINSMKTGRFNTSEEYYKNKFNN